VELKKKRRETSKPLMVGTWNNWEVDSSFPMDWTEAEY